MDNPALAEFRARVAEALEILHELEGSRNRDDDKTSLRTSRDAIEQSRQLLKRLDSASAAK
jgi:hypothetical protein